MLHLPPERKKTKKQTPEKKFSGEIREAIQALGRNARKHNFDDVGQVVAGRAARRPADWEFTYKGAHVVLELKAIKGPTLPYSKIEFHQVRTLLREHDAGGFGLVLVKQLLARPRVWVIPAPMLREHELDIGVRGSFVLGPPLLEVVKAPREGFDGLYWGLAWMMEQLVAERGTKC